MVGNLLSFDLSVGLTTCALLQFCSLLRPDIQCVITNSKVSSSVHGTRSSKNFENLQLYQSAELSLTVFVTVFVWTYQVRSC